MLILSGKEVAAKVLADVKADVAFLRQKTPVPPTLAVILVGEDPASQIYVRNKKRAADEVGIATRDYLFPQGCSQAELLATIADINRDPAIHGILLNSAPHAARKRAQSDIVQWLRKGGLVHTVSAVYPLARTADAHAAVEYAPKNGTVVVDCTA